MMTRKAAPARRAPPRRVVRLVNGGPRATYRRHVSQVGKTSMRLDAKRRPAAKAPGWRPSPSGGYFENRRNRSDVNKTRRL